MNKINPKIWIKNEKSIHAMSVKDLERKFQVDTTKGLSSIRAKEIHEKNRNNNISYTSILKAVFWSQADFFSILLGLTLFFSVILYVPLGRNSPSIANLISAGQITMFFLIKSFFVGIQEYNSIKSIRKLQSMNKSRVSVLRDSVWTSIPACDLVIGDVVEIRAHQHVPADLRLIYVENLFFDKSILTGDLIIWLFVRFNSA